MALEQLCVLLCRDASVKTIPQDSGRWKESGLVVGASTHVFVFVCGSVASVVVGCSGERCEVGAGDSQLAVVDLVQYVYLDGVSSLLKRAPLEAILHFGDARVPSPVVEDEACSAILHGLELISSGFTPTVWIPHGGSVFSYWPDECLIAGRFDRWAAAPEVPLKK